MRKLNGLPDKVFLQGCGKSAIQSHGVIYKSLTCKNVLSDALNMPESLVLTGMRLLLVWHGPLEVAVTNVARK